MINVIFRYPEAKGLFVDVPNFKPGGAPIQTYTLATELAKDSSFNVYFWVDGEVPEEHVDGVKLFSSPDLISKGIPILSRFKNEGIKAEFQKRFIDSVCIYTVADNLGLPEQQKMIHEVGGKTIYRVASDVDVKPELRFSDGNDPYTKAIFSADKIIAQTLSQKEILRQRFRIDADVVRSSFRESEYNKIEKDCVLWVGHSVAIKRPWVVSELARRFPDEKFVMIIPEVDANIALAFKDGADKITNLEVIAHVDPDEIQTYFNRAKVVLNTSVYEGYPNTLHQASIGRAPYLSLSWNPDGYLEANGMGVGADNDVEKMAQLLKKYLEDEELRNSTGENAYKNFKNEHDVSVAIEDLKAVIRNVAMLKS